MLVYQTTGGGAGSLSNALTVRKAVPHSQPTTVIPAHPRPTTRAPQTFGAPGRLPHPKHGSANAPLSKITGEPIRQLERTRNAPMPNRDLVMASRNPAKDGDFEGVGNLMPIKRESENSRKRRHLALQGERRNLVASLGGKVVLGNKGSGLDYYKGIRLKPALPDGRADVSAATRPTGIVTSTYLHTATPAGTATRLALEGMRADDIRRKSTLPAASHDNIELSRVAIMRANKTALISGDDTAQDSTGRFMFLIAATVVAVLILKR